MWVRATPCIVEICARDDARQILVALDVHDADEVPLAGDRVGLADALDLGQRSAERRHHVSLGFDEHDRVRHGCVPFVVVVAPRGELARELEADGHADEHRQPRLLGDERVDRSRRARSGPRSRGDLASCASCASSNQPPGLERGAEHALQAGRGVRDDLLGVAEALGVRQRLDGGVDLLGAVASRCVISARPQRRRARGRRARRGRRRTTPGERAALRQQRHEQQHGRDDEHAEQVGVVVLRRGAAREQRPARARRTAARARRRGVPKTSAPGSIATAIASAAGPQSKNSATTASGPWRRSISQPKSPRPTTTANCAAVPSLSSEAVR